ncbi:uncharacterized protein LOC127881241 isoform X2 [Dreissena polymorpha]|nr:uncharacterized protein LOC127881241 isoform X2 [Dreissena polymorpha]XP_052284941.1 uncharacterized protein LOC127881241 isoform X2 [Dreissena polymorpha]XP_052284942.1 uncharacterized protein LOC127881241 isoform X2 [Dreissena polymorpha]
MKTDSTLPQIVFLPRAEKELFYRKFRNDGICHSQRDAPRIPPLPELPSDAPKTVVKLERHKRAKRPEKWSRIIKRRRHSSFLEVREKTRSLYDKLQGPLFCVGSSSDSDCIMISSGNNAVNSSVIEKQKCSGGAEVKQLNKAVQNDMDGKPCKNVKIVRENMKSQEEQALLRFQRCSSEVPSSNVSGKENSNFVRSASVNTCHNSSLKVKKLRHSSPSKRPNLSLSESEESDKGINDSEFDVLENLSYSIRKRYRNLKILGSEKVNVKNCTVVLNDVQQTKPKSRHFLDVFGLSDKSDDELPNLSVDENLKVPVPQITKDELILDSCICMDNLLLSKKSRCISYPECISISSESSDVESGRKSDGPLDKEDVYSITDTTEGSDSDFSLKDVDRVMVKIECVNDNLEHIEAASVKTVPIDKDTNNNDGVTVKTDLNVVHENDGVTVEIETIEHVVDNFDEKMETDIFVNVVMEFDLAYAHTETVETTSIGQIINSIDVPCAVKTETACNVSMSEADCIRNDTDIVEHNANDNSDSRTLSAVSEIDSLRPASVSNSPFRPSASALSALTSFLSSGLTISKSKSSSPTSASSSVMSSVCSSAELHIEQCSLVRATRKVFSRRSSENKTHKVLLPNSHMNFLDACFDDDNNDIHIGSYLEYLEEFTYNYRIPDDTVKTVLKSIYFSKIPSSLQINKASAILMNLSKQQHGLTGIHWEMVESSLSRIYGPNKSSNFLTLFQATQFLRLCLCVLKDELYSNDVMQDFGNIRKSQAYKLFSYNSIAANRKVLMFYFNQAVHVGQVTSVDFEGKRKSIPQVLPIIQEILCICVEVSTSCLDCSRNLAVDLVGSYKFLPDLESKDRLVRTISSPLLQYRTVQSILEAQYDGYLPLASFPTSLKAVIEAFFQVEPLKLYPTPPTTPTMDSAQVGLFISLSACETDEIAMLLYYLVASYLSVVSNQAHLPLHRRKEPAVRPCDAETLQLLGTHVDRLTKHLQLMCSYLSKTCERYLMLMRCLGS